MLAQDATAQDAATQDTAGAAGKSVQSQSPLLSLPAEIRNKIYRYLMISRSGIIYLDPATFPRGEYDEPQVYKALIDTSLFRTCHQIYQEASAIMYRENFFQSFCNYIYNPLDHHLMPNFKLIRNLEVTIYMSYEEPLGGVFCGFFSTLVTLSCSFKNLTLRYRVASPNEEECFRPTIGEGPQLLELTCAIDVQCQLEMCFERRGLDETRATILRDYIVAVAARKSWTATDTKSDPDHERYLLHPGNPMPSKQQ